MKHQPAIPPDLPPLTDEFERPVCACDEFWPNQGHHPECPVGRRFADLERQLAEARTALEDKARLDWLEANQQTVWRSMREEWQATTEADMARRKVTVFEGWAVNGDDEPSPTIREAIDKALARLDGQPSP